MLKMISKPAVKMVERYLPDPYIFVLLLTLIAAAAAIAIERQTPLAVLRFWGDGFGDYSPSPCRCCWYW